MKKSLNREKLADQVYVELKERIRNHRFSPGSRINVEAITDELDISRTPIWEAIRRLERDGLVENPGRNKGVYMKTLSRQEALKLYEVREVLEGLSARLCAECITDDALKKLASILKEQQKIVEKQDLIAYSRSDFDFHKTIYDACGNHILSELLENIKNRMQPINIHVANHLEGFYEDHIRVFEALRNRSSSEAEEAFRIHNQRVMHIIEEEMEEEMTVGAQSRRSKGAP